MRRRRNPELFLKVGEAAKAAGRVWALLIDEVQCISTQELGALIVAIHRINQKALPVLLFGAGLPGHRGPVRGGEVVRGAAFRLPQGGRLARRRRERHPAAD